ncbi:MAG: hypothetical protein N4A40_06400 [Tissierellales bacterium]|jgi:hypothetical protein|nr:hypothetical protein [Tissierellales bacterium]
MREHKLDLMKKIIKLINFNKIDGFYFISELEEVVENILDMLYEITEARTIAIALYDETKKIYNVKRVYKKGEYRPYYGDVELNASDFEPYKIEKIEFGNEGIEGHVDLSNLRAENIVLLKNGSITGFVSFSELSQSSLDFFEKNEELFNFIDFLLKIAENNSLNIEQMDLMEKQRMQLATLYDVMANIQSAITLEELFESLLATMSIVYKITESCILEKTKSKKYRLLKSRGDFREVKNEIDCINQSNFGKIDYGYNGEKIDSNFDGLEIGERTNCSIIAPIDKRLLGLESIGHAEYYWVIGRVEGGLRLEIIQAIEMIVKMLSSMYSNYKMKRLEEQNTVDENAMFLGKLAEKIDDMQKYDIEFYLSYKRIRFNPFEKIDKSQYEGVDIVGDYAFDIGFDPELKEGFSRVEKLETIDDFLSYEFK